MPVVGELLEVILYVQDMDAQVSFYRDTLGLKVREPQDIHDFSAVYWVELDTGSCTLALHGGGQRRFGIDAPKIVFHVADLSVTREQSHQQGISLGEVHSPGPGIQVCDGVDPEGNRFSIESRE